MGSLVARIGDAAALAGVAVFARGNMSFAAPGVVVCDRVGSLAIALAFGVAADTTLVRSPLVCFGVAVNREANWAGRVAAPATTGFAGTGFDGVAVAGFVAAASAVAGSPPAVDCFAAG